MDVSNHHLEQKVGVQFDQESEESESPLIGRVVFILIDS